jgi:hypothetical protein
VQSPAAQIGTQSITSVNRNRLIVEFLNKENELTNKPTIIDRNGKTTTNN